jgi:hypothetical protein
MIELLVRFKEAENFYIFLILTAACVLWVYARLKSSKGVNLIPVIILNFALFAGWGMLSELNHDDVAFLHFSWLISQGLVPFRDFWDHHSPFLAVVLSPFMKIAPQSPAIYDIARIMSGCMFVINASLGWFISRQVWQDRARLSVYLLVVSSAGIMAHYLLLRPDLFMIFFMLAGISGSLEISRKGAVSCFLAGVAFGLAMSFVPKQYLLVFLPAIAIFSGEQHGRAGKLTAYCVGICAGIVPLLSYLAGAGILQDFLSWVIVFNAQALQVSVHIPLVLLAAGIWGASALMRRNRASRDMRAVVITYAFILSTISSLTTMTDQEGLYYLALWYFICAIAASGAGIPQLLGRVPSLWKRSLIAGLVFGALLSPNCMLVWKYRDANYAKGKKAMAELMKYTRQDQCVLVLPNHPVFARDATRLYSGWQFYFTTMFPVVRADAMKGGIARCIMDSSPAVVICRYNKKDFVLELYQRKLITSTEYKTLIGFLTTHYKQKQISDQVYYIRNDKL